VTDLYYVIYLLSWFVFLSAVSHAAVCCKAEEGLPLNKSGFCESFSPVCGCIYLLIYFAVTTFAGDVAEASGSEFLIQNLDFAAYLLLVLCVAVLMWGFYKGALRAFGEHSEENLNKSLIILLITVAAMALLLIIASFIIGIESSNQNAVSAWQTNAAVKVITVCIFGPVVEETAYRGILFRLLRRDTKIFAHAAAALIFGLEHCIYYVLGGDVLQLVMALPYAILGLGLSVMYERTGNICYPVIAHIFINAVSFCSGLA